MERVASYLKQAGKYTQGFDKEFREENEGAIEMEALFHKYDVAVVDFVAGTKYGKKYIDNLKKVIIVTNRDQSLLNTLEQQIIKFNDENREEWTKIFVDGSPMYVQKIDSTHLYYQNQPKKGIALHVAELMRNKPLYEDLLKWLQGRARITNKKYKG